MVNACLDDSRIDIFPWDNNFNIGVDEIDEQHKHMVRLLNRVATHLTHKPATTSVDCLINELIDYSAYHMDYEESYWSQSLSSASLVHQHEESHRLFRERVKTLKDQVTCVTEEKGVEELLQFYASWIAPHILQNDKRMVLLVESINSGKSVDAAECYVDRIMQATTETILNVVFVAYQNLTANTIKLFREINSGQTILEKLSESEEKLSQAMDYAKIEYWSCPYAGDIASWMEDDFYNFSLTQNSTPGAGSLFGVMPKDFQHRFLNSVRESFKTGLELHIVYPIILTREGEERWIECRGRVSYKDDGTPGFISGFLQDITNRKMAEQQITQLAYYDSLTKLPNRRLLFDRLHQVIAASRRNHFTNGLLFLDVDDFKNVNDHHGHEYGDILLQDAATRIKECLRDSDTLARFGGDAFVVLLPDLDKVLKNAASQAEIVADKILNTLSIPFQLNDVEYRSSISIGIVLFNDNTRSESDLLKQADIAMFRAKVSGKNTACFFDPDMQKEITERLVLENDLRKAISEEQFELYYQPQNSRSDEVIGAEALIRWNHPVKGIVGPDKFIPIAEETGLIIPIGEFVLKTACAQLNEWKKSSLTCHLSLSVNVSYRQFKDPEFAPMVCQLVDNYQLEKGRLRIELTESMFVDDLDMTIMRMNEMRQKGVDFSLDDFGTGYSSLRNLKRLPLCELKIDKSFIDDLETNDNDRSIVRTIISMSDSLGLKVIAEGVENQLQKEYLNNKNCLSYQGYFYSRPLPIDEFQRYLSEQNSQSNLLTLKSFKAM